MSREATLADELARTIENEILTGVLKPGDPLDERFLSERFEMSRTPVREALIKLSISELVTISRGRGAVVTSIAVPELIEMFEVMGELEALCAQLAARRILQEEFQHLASLYERCCQLRDSRDPDGYYVANMDFHEAIYSASKNGYLERQTKSLRNRLSPYRRLQLHRPGRLKSSSDEHERVLKAIGEGDAVTAAEEMRKHVNVQGAALNDLIAIMPPGYLRKAG
jgi:DNA-binding GntR family transcriptional regulator